GGRVDRHTAVPDLAEGQGRVGVVSHEGGHVEGHREPATTGGEDHLVALVGLSGVAETGELADGPGPTSVAGRVQATRVGVFPGPTDALEPGNLGAGPRSIEGLEGATGQRGEVGLTLARGVVAALPALASGPDLRGPGVVGGAVRGVDHTQIVGRPSKSVQGRRMRRSPRQDRSGLLYDPCDRGLEVTEVHSEASEGSMYLPQLLTGVAAEPEVHVEQHSGGFLGDLTTLVGDLRQNTAPVARVGSAQ